MTIPKIIHYCWFGDAEKPPIINKSIESFYKFHSDWEIKFWNESNFARNDYVNFCLKHNYWVKITDYLRLKVLYEYGGIYLDADAEIIKPLDNLLKNTVFFGFESPALINHAISGAVQKHRFLKLCLDTFLTTFDGTQYNVDGGPTFITNMLKAHYNLKHENKIVKYDDITIYPEKYFFPFYYNQEYHEKHITSDTYIIHHWAKTWVANTKYYNIE